MIEEKMNALLEKVRDLKRLYEKCRRRNKELEKENLYLKGKVDKATEKIEEIISQIDRELENDRKEI